MVWPTRSFGRSQAVAYLPFPCGAPSEGVAKPQRLCAERCHPERGAARNLLVRLTLAPTEGSCPHHRRNRFSAQNSARGMADKILRSLAGDCVSSISVRRSLRMTRFLARFSTPPQDDTLP